MKNHLYRTVQFILLLSLIFLLTEAGAQVATRVWGTTQGASGGSVFYMDSQALKRSLTTDSLSKVGIQPVFIMQARSGYVYGISSSTSSSDPAGILFRINEKGASKICNLPSPLGKSTKIIESTDGYLYGIGQSTSGTNSTVFKVKLDGTGFVSRKIALYAFHGRGGLMTTASGKILGMSESGGQNGQGFIYELLPDLSVRSIFSFEKSGGKRPFGNLVESGGFLYGLTNSGGLYNYGAVFRVREDGQSFSTLHHFNLTNGAYPQGGLLIRDGFAYGLTTKGGTYKKGIVFKIRLDGAAYTIIHNFDGAGGEFPEGDLAIDDVGILTGTARGGMQGSGVLFSLKSDGTGFRVLHHFNQELPSAQLLRVKEAFIPLIALTTPLPGATNAAVHGIYRSRSELEARSYTLQLSEDPKFLTVTRTITNSVNQYDLGSSYLKFSTTYYARVKGNVWPVFGATTTFKTRSAADYAYITQPADQAVGVIPNQLKVTVNPVPGAKRYHVQLCTTQDFSTGVISDSSRTDGQRTFIISGLSYSKRYYVRAKSNLSAFGKTTVFTTAPEPAVQVSLPHGGGLQDASMLAIECSTVAGAETYTVQISKTSDFSAPKIRTSVVSGQTSFVIKDLESQTHYYVRAKSDLSSQFGPMFELDTRPSVAQKRLWGLTTRGGESNLGTIFSFSIDSGTFTRHLDYYNPADYIALTGSLTQTPTGLAGLSVADGTGGGEVFSFSKEGLRLLEDYGPHQGSVMLASDNYLYIIDDWINYFRGGIYKIFSSGDSVNVFDRIIFRFSSDAQGINPAAKLLEYTDGFLYGCTPAKGQFDKGTLYKLKMDGSSFQVIHHFNGADGNMANTELIAGNDGYLYGVTTMGGMYDHGVIYKILPNGSGYKVIHHFDGVTGSNPEGALTQVNGKLFGTAALGGAHGQGVVFSINEDGTSFTRLLSFDGVSGATPRGELTLAGNTLYGMTAAGGTSNLGVIFRMALDGTSFQTLFTFTPESGGAPDGGLLLLEDTFYPPSPSVALAQNDDRHEAPITIYPNPFSDTFRAEGFQHDASFVIRDMSGTVRMSTVPGDVHEMGAELEKGIYLLTVKQGTKTSTHRLVKH
jgi:uncharacterized repeat protein (TIGR03803 family)